MAQVLHASGLRARGPFVAINCAAISETLLEAALFGFEAGAFSEARRAKPGLFEAASRKAYGTKAKRMRWPSAHPVFNAERRDIAEVSEKYRKIKCIDTTIES